jgi:Fe-S-cluster containining protein
MLITDLEEIRRYALRNEKKNWKFRTFLKSIDKPSIKIDPVVHRIYADVVKQIDCTRCANCCKTLQAVVTRDEIVTISGHLNIPETEFISRYLKLQPFSSEHAFAQRPCPFLENNLCRIYEIRPEDCRSYPHLWKKEFRSRTMGVIANYAICPIVFNVYEQLKVAFKFRN